MLSSGNILANNGTNAISNFTKSSNTHEFFKEILKNREAKKDLLSRLKEIPLDDPETLKLNRDLESRVYIEYLTYINSYRISKEELDFAKGEYAKPEILSRIEKEFYEQVIVASWLQARGGNIIKDMEEEFKNQKEIDEIIGVTKDIEYPVKEAKYIFNIISWFVIESGRSGDDLDL